MKLSRPTVQMIAIYAIILATAAFALEWLQYQYFLKRYPAEFYILMIAIGFAILGVWVGARLTKQTNKTIFERNDAALKTLGISQREFEVLEALASGQSNKEIARSLEISPNTVKTHVARLFEKLEVNGRVRAIEEARSLHLIP